MNTAPVNSSTGAIPPSGAASASVANDALRPVADASTAVSETKKRMSASAVVTLFATGLVLGAIGATLSMWIPMNRVVVFAQPYDNFVSVRSVRIAKPGFIVLNIKDVGGLRTENPYYLDKGYYRDLLLPIDGSDIAELAPKSLEFVIRMYVDDGDQVFDPERDSPVRDMFGRVMSRAFSMEYNVTELGYARITLVDHPLRFIYDMLFP